MTNVHSDRAIDDVDGATDSTDPGPSRRTWLKTAALGAAADRLPRKNRMVTVVGGHALTRPHRRRNFHYADSRI